VINDLAMHDARSSKADDAGGASSDLFLKPGDNRKPSRVGTGIIANALSPRLLLRALWAARRGGRR